MDVDVIIGIDNGSTGSYAVYTDRCLRMFAETPHYTFRKPTKKESNISRIDWREFEKQLTRWYEEGDRAIAVIERPISTSIRFQATISSQRAMESLLCLMERLNIPVMTIDSSVWQKHYFPDVHGSDQLKAASREIGAKRFPEYAELIRRHGDADGLLIATALVEKKFQYLADSERVFEPKIKIKKKRFTTDV